MVMRVTQQSMYGTVIRQNNAALSALMETNLQSSTQKRINYPSDDPAGTSQVLDTRTNLSELTQYRRNIDSAQGWLTQSDSTLTSVSTLITSIKAYAEQGATGTVTSENRQEISTAVRQYFQQLISLANNKYGDYNIFSGQKTDTAPFEQTLWMNSNLDALNDSSVTGSMNIQGSTSSTMLVQFVDSGTISIQPSFRYSEDGGSTWHTLGDATDAKAPTYAAVPPAGKQQLQMNGVTIDLTDTVNVTGCGTDTSNTDGTWMWIRPSAVYKGNANSDDPTVMPGYIDPLGIVVMPTATASGDFKGNIAVRLDDVSGSPYTYSYSVDGGTTWVENQTSGVVTATSATLPVPGGILTIDPSTGTFLANNNQYFIQPSTADVTMDISPTESVVVNNVGKDVFGGIYNNATVSMDGSVDGNLFETMGKLIGYLETGNQHGCQEALDQITASQSHVLTVAASVGARENRVTSADTLVQNLEENSNTTLSNVEDADISALVTKLAQQELAYQAVLKSSSTVMQLSLVNYL